MSYQTRPLKNDAPNLFIGRESIKHIQQLNFDIHGIHDCWTIDSDGGNLILLME
jgi:hypothetical protein